MPRIAFIPSPISFADDPSNRIVAPIMQNAMGLLDTYATEVPRLRMQTERHDADMAWQQKARGRQEQEWRMADEDRQTKADEAAAAGLLGLLGPDAADYDADGTPDLLIGDGKRGAKGLSAAVPATRAPAAKAGKEYDPEVWKAAQKRVEDQFPDFRVDTSGASPVTVPLVGADREAVMRQRREALLNSFAGQAGYAPLLAGYGVNIDRLGNTLPTTGEEGAAGVVPGETAAGVGAAGAAGAGMMGRMLMSPARREAALAYFDRVKAIPAERRARMGLSDERLWAIYQQLGGMPAGDSRPVEARSAIDAATAPTLMPTLEEQTAGMVEEVPEAVIPPAGPPQVAPPVVAPEDPGIPYPARVNIDDEIKKLTAEAQVDPARTPNPRFDFLANTVGVEAPLQLRLEPEPARLPPLQAAQAMLNPSGLPWWLRGQMQPDALPEELPADLPPSVAEGLPAYLPPPVADFLRGGAGRLRLGARLPPLDPRGPAVVDGIPQERGGPAFLNWINNMDARIAAGYRKAGNAYGFR